MKRTLSIVLTVVMLFAMIPLSSLTAFATSNTIISVENVSAILDSTVDVSVSISGNPGIASMGFTLTFDEDLTLVGASNGEAFSEMTLTPPAQLKKVGYVNDSCRFAWLGNENVTENGTILNLKFKVAADAQLNKDCFISITCDHGDVLDDTRTPVDVEISNGKVTIIDYTPGDVDGDSNITMMDVLTLCQFYVDGCKYDPNGYGINIKSECGDVDANGKVNMIDVLMICQYYVDGCKYDPDGYAVKLLPGKTYCEHILKKTEEYAPTCTDDGNIAYWHCTKCGEYYSDANASNVISLESTVVKAKGHTVVVDPAVPATYESTGLTEGSHCSVCGEILVAREEYGPLIANTANIIYKIAYTETVTKNGTKTVVPDNYIATQTIANDNPNTYSVGTGVAEFKDLSLDGYDFLGWFESPEVGAQRVYSISTSEAGDKTVYGIWSEKTYSITYKLYKTPLADSIDSKYCSYTISKGLADLPNPTINNYVFLGWYTNDGVEVTEIPVGTSGDLILNAYWTSKRNLAKAKSQLDDPIILEDTDNGVVYFAYELGTIENIPLSDNIWTIQSVAGLAQQKSETYTTSLTQSKADTISNTISNSTVDSGTWTLSEGWSDVTSVTQEWADEHKTTVEEANEQCKTASKTYSLTDSSGGADTTTKTDGTTTVDYNSQNYTHGNSAEFGAKISGSYSNKGNLSSKIAGEFSVSGELSANYEQHKDTNEHTGTDTTTVDTRVDSSSSTWNSSSTSSSTKTASEKNTVSKAISDIISSKTGYGSSYTKNGQNSETQGFSNTESNSVNSSSSLTWSSVETHTVTNTYSTDGKSEGCYRLVIAGKAHVFGVVGYDIASKSYFTYTYSIMDDEQYEFLDYSPDLNFNDCENGVLPFEIPFFVYEYSTAATVRTEGLVFRTDSTNNTASVTKYTGESLDVTIPNYITTGGIAYKVTSISASAFAGKNIRSIILSKFVKELPAGAFKNCSALKQISGYYNVIGDEAFSGCSSLENYNITASTKSIGANAFSGVSSIVVSAISGEYALEYADNDVDAARILTQELVNSAVSSGANSIILSLANVIDGCEFSIDVSEIDCFELHGAKNKSFANLKLNSKAKTTILKNLTIDECKHIPFEISSSNLILDTVQINSQGYCLMLPGNTEISLIRDNVMNSINNKAIVCKNPNFVSVSNDSVAGFLEVFGNVYVCGSISGIDDIDVKTGEIVYISEEDFNKYIKGSFNITFDVNGGNSLAETEKTVYFGNVYGELPTPTRNYYSFNGWFTSAEGGDEITSDTIYNMSVDSILYAHWSQNSTSGWVLKSEAPDDAEIVNSKYAYDLTSYTTSTASSLSGWSQYKDPTTSYGSWGGWSGWTTSVIYGSDTREVDTTTTQEIDSYNVEEYNYKLSGNRVYYKTRQNINNSYGEFHRTMTVSPAQINSAQQVGAGAYANIGDSTSGYNKTGETAYVLDYGGLNIMFFIVGTNYRNVTYYRYRDRSKTITYYYSKTEAKESANNPSGQANVSNVKEWVQYRAK